jgi:hypothetical protein
MKGHGSKFERKMEAAIAALLTHRSVEDAARAVGIGINTLLRWMQMQEFEAAYRKARRAAVSQATARLQQNSGAAAAAILKIMVDPNTPASCRLRAADLVLEYSRDGIELEDLDVRVVELEREAGLAKSSESLLGNHDDEHDRQKNKAA